MQRKAAVLDIGNGLVGRQSEAFYDRVIGKARPQQLFADADLYGKNRAVDTGAPCCLSTTRLKTSQLRLRAAGRCIIVTTWEGWAALLVTAGLIGKAEAGI